MEVGAERGDMQKNRRSDDASRKTHASSCSSLKMFLVALSFAYFAKALSGSYMKSTITQLERRFDIPSYLIGIIDGSFEIGNLLVIAFVSYFGAKLHRPKIIAVGCVLMSIGTFIIALPHFIIGRYEYDSPPRWVVNSSLTPSPCSVGSTSDLSQDSKLLEVPTTDCEGDSNLSMWIYVLLGNVLRGIGETPVQPLGISYIDDFASEENAALYVGCVQTISVVGPVFGYLLGSLCAKIYVDIGFVKLETITITPADSRWVGAWWLGYLIAGVITLLSAIPFWFLPRSLPIPGSHTPEKPEQTSFIKDSDPMKHKYPVEEHTSFIEMAKGVINIPAVALGMFSGGLLMKKMKLNITGAAKFAFVTSFIGYILSLFLFVMSCENAKIAGVTLPYNSMEGVSHDKHSVFTTCNSNCFCSANNWDPVCGGNGITYVSPCLAGCTSSTGSGKNTVFSNCSCVGPAANLTANIGQCSDKDDCDRMFPYFLALSVITSFIISLGGTPGYMLLIRCIKPQLKSFALGFHALATHTLAGIPAPIYFGAIIDTTCLKWGQKRCGGRGACRIYNTTAYRIAYLGLTLGLRTISFLICIPGFILLSRQLKEEHDTLRGSLANGGTELEVLRKEEFVISNSKTLQRTSENGTDRETRL
ncbi:solute carrier organic anion transporter family member 1C1 isoform X2 [Phyllopteryx taeniolatus]|uniref:solute carrier organic anion transporter family member 1C1 isoform X2 n=1 Tax=Phyllopteryx taeniolatus TaxID=161469 RepID=UPI002AD2DDBF|nr:solute carrier organic anion transporter family member 1C1 isoform X2 [Phyllopteryx taeniolatus]